MSAEKRHPAEPPGPWLLVEGPSEGLESVNLVMGGFCWLVALTAIAAWLQGAMTLTGVLAICAFPVANAIIIIVSLRFKQHAFSIELFRIGLGLLLAPVCSAFADGALAPFWPAFLVMVIGGLMVFGLTEQRARWSQLLIAAHVLLFILATVLLPPRTDVHSSAEPTVNVYQVIMLAGVIGMVGLMMTAIISLLGKNAVLLRDRSRELTVARDALFAELNVAHEIQTLLLPKAPELPGNEVTGKMVPATEVGGDYYDVIQVDGKRSFLAVGDVSGHGLTSGLTMMMARTALLGILEAKPDISLVEAYRALNRCLRHNLARMSLDMYMTFVLLESKGGGRFEAVGQHLPLLIFRSKTRKIEEVELEGVWLGLVDNLTADMLPCVELRLEPGDLLVIYTDGVVEHFAGREMFGFPRFKEVVLENAALGPVGLIDATLARLKDFSDDQKDDITMMVVNHKGESQGSRPADATSSVVGEPPIAARGAA